MSMKLSTAGYIVVTIVATFLIPELVLDQNFRMEEILFSENVKKVADVYNNPKFYYAFIVYAFLSGSLWLYKDAIERWFKKKKKKDRYFLEIDKISKKLSSMPKSLEEYFENILFSLLSGNGKLDTQISKAIYRQDGLGIKGKTDSILNNGIKIDKEAYIWLLETVLKNNISSGYYGIWDIDTFEPTKYHESLRDTYLKINDFLIQIHRDKSNIRIFLTDKELTEEFIIDFVTKYKVFLNDVVINQWGLAEIYFVGKRLERTNNWSLEDGLIVNNKEKFVIRFDNDTKRLTFDLDRVDEIVDSLKILIKSLNNKYIYKDDNNDTELIIWYP